jgi:hypothetical protein
MILADPSSVMSAGPASSGTPSPTSPSARDPLALVIRMLLDQSSVPSER